MPLIAFTISPREYRLIEGKLRDRWVMVARAEQMLYQAQQRAFSPRAAVPDVNKAGRCGRRQRDRDEKNALEILRAEEQLETARRWQEVFCLLDKAFPAGTDEGFFAELIFGNGLTQAEVSAQAHCDRQTVRRRMNNYIGHCWRFALEAGLLKPQEEI